MQGCSKKNAEGELGIRYSHIQSLKSPIKLNPKFGFRQGCILISDLCRENQILVYDAKTQQCSSGGFEYIIIFPLSKKLNVIQCLERLIFLKRKKLSHNTVTAALDGKNVISWSGAKVSRQDDTIFVLNVMHTCPSASFTRSINNHLRVLMLENMNNLTCIRDDQILTVNTLMQSL